MRIEDKLNSVDWTPIAEQLHRNGYAIVPKLLDAAQCAELIAGYDTAEHYRKTVVMERYRFGLGEYKYLNYPLPRIIQSIREYVYAQLAPVANAWMQALSLDISYPEEHAAFLQECHAQGQDKATVLLLKYGVGGFNTLHQDLYGDVWFPVQAVLFLNEPGVEYSGGEFVLTEQVPRAQSKAIVLQPKKGDMLLFAMNFRPVKGSKGYYRVTMKHGVSQLHSGERHTLGIIFHDALS